MSTPAPTKSFVEVSAESHFPIQNIPFGVFKTSDGAARCASRIGDTVRDGDWATQTELLYIHQ